MTPTHLLNSGQTTAVHCLKSEDVDDANFHPNHVHLASCLGFSVSYFSHVDQMFGKVFWRFKHDPEALYRKPKGQSRPYVVSRKTASISQS